jgi:hypothetical protein
LYEDFGEWQATVLEELAPQKLHVLPEPRLGIRILMLRIA